MFEAEAVPDPISTEEAIEQDAKFWAGQVVDNIAERGEELSEKEALETLAVLDADRNITDHLDADELDTFLDEFEEAIDENADKKEAIQDAIEDASETPKE